MKSAREHPRWNELVQAARQHGKRNGAKAVETIVITTNGGIKDEDGEADLGAVPYDHVPELITIFQSDAESFAMAKALGKIGRKVYGEPEEMGAALSTTGRTPTNAAELDTAKVYAKWNAAGKRGST